MRDRTESKGGEKRQRESFFFQRETRSLSLLRAICNESCMYGSVKKSRFFNTDWYRFESDSRLSVSVSPDLRDTTFKKRKQNDTINLERAIF